MCPRYARIDPPLSTLQVIDISRIARPFRFVFLANYCEFIFGGLLALGFLQSAVVSAFAGEGQAAVVVFSLLLGIAFGYCALVGWQNKGALDLVMQPYSAWKAVGLGTAFALIGILLGLTAPFSDNVFLLLLMIGLISCAAIASALSLLYARRLSIPVLHLRLDNFLKCITGSVQMQGPQAALPATNRSRGITFVILGICYFAALRWVPDEISGVKANFGGMLGIPGFLLLIHARQYFRPDFKTVIAADKRPPILFLRSFADDEKINYQRADRQLFDFSLESRLEHHFSAFGPFIAVGAAKTPYLGAVRAELSDAEWQDRVARWMREAQLVVLVAGTSPGIAWELKRVLTLGYPAKLIILFPQITKARKKKDAAKRLEALREVFAGTIWQGGLGELGKHRTHSPERIRSIVLKPTGNVVAITSRPRNRDSYHLAALIAFYFKFPGIPSV